uniref:Uncharacterized protein n=1 Tax=Amphimedon queenslandica TaxID=400682 RepID=A0A1X7VDV4_AMPQE
RRCQAMILQNMIRKIPRTPRPGTTSTHPTFGNIRRTYRHMDAKVFPLPSDRAARERASHFQLRAHQFVLGKVLCSTSIS